MNKIIYEQINELLEQLKTKPFDKKLSNHLATLYFQCKKYQEAEILLHKTLMRHPNDPQLMNNLAEAFQAQGKLLAAMHLFRKLKKLHPTYASAAGGSVTSLHFSKKGPPKPKK